MRHFRAFSSFTLLLALVMPLISASAQNQLASLAPLPMGEARESKIVVRLKSFKPEKVVSKQLHAEWPISLEVDGTYHNLAIFCDRVGKFTRTVNISDLDVKGKTTPDSNSTITASLVATTFVLLDKPAAAKAAAAAKPGAPAPGKGT